jgi:hypothetical protein
MHCPICDKDSDSVTLVKPCSECQEAIQECLDGYPRDDTEDNDDESEVLDESWDNFN